jgi:hypothetical protein
LRSSARHFFLKANKEVTQQAFCCQNKEIQEVFKHQKNET